VKAAVSLARPPKDSLIKIRCSGSLKERLARHAVARDRPIATVVRDACTFYLAQQETAQLTAR